MTFNQLTIFVEGEYDELFFSEIVKKIFESQGIYDDIQIFKYCTKEIKFIERYIRSLVEMNNSETQYDYIFVTDLDPPIFNCVRVKKDHILGKIQPICSDKIVIVVNEIEGWYLAGISEKSRKKMGIGSNEFNSTDPNLVIKEAFDEKIKPKKYSKLEFMLEIVKLFDLKIAKQRNDSFNYFTQHFLEI
ncbi:MAG: hypothetical protein ACYDDV_10905 [Methanoregula sp.]